MGVQHRLSGHACDREARERGALVRKDRMEQAVLTAQADARKAWKSREKKLQSCVHEPIRSRKKCISQIEGWLKLARLISVRVHGGIETIETDCGLRQPTFQTQTQQIVAEDLGVATTLLEQLKAEPLFVATPGIRGRAGPKPSVLEGASDAERAGIVKDWEDCGKGAHKGCTDLGYSYQMGHGVRQDYARALSLYRLGCDRGSSTGCSNLGFMYDKALGVKRSSGLAIKLYRQGCDEGSALGCSNLGTMYQTGDGVEKSYPRAHDLYKYGCEHGNALACRNQGRMYDKGIGMGENFPRAAALYLKACEGGDGGGCTNLGILYENGTGVKKSPTRALHLYKKSCQKGRALGCFYAGVNLSEGIGVPADLPQSRHFFQKACRLGNKDACGKL